MGKLKAVAVKVGTGSSAFGACMLRPGWTVLGAEILGLDWAEASSRLQSGEDRAVAGR